MLPVFSHYPSVRPFSVARRAGSARLIHDPVERIRRLVAGPVARVQLREVIL